MRVVGLVSQYDASLPYEGGHRLLPRRPADILFGPSRLPNTGGEGPSLP